MFSLAGESRAFIESGSQFCSQMQTSDTPLSWPWLGGSLASLTNPTCSKQPRGRPPPCDVTTYLRGPGLDALLGHFLQAVHVAAVQGQQGSELGEQDARPGADARAGPSDQSHFAPQRGHLRNTLVRHRQASRKQKYISTEKLVARTHKVWQNKLTLHASPDDIFPFKRAVHLWWRH